MPTHKSVPSQADLEPIAPGEGWSGPWTEWLLDFRREDLGGGRDHTALGRSRVGGSQTDESELEKVGVSLYFSLSPPSHGNAVSWLWVPGSWGDECERPLPARPLSRPDVSTPVQKPRATSTEEGPGSSLIVLDKFWKMGWSQQWGEVSGG